MARTMTDEQENESRAALTLAARVAELEVVVLRSTELQAATEHARQQMTDRVAELEKENTVIRGLLVKHECPYGEKSLGECSRGFPGCACADDMLATASWCPEDEDKAAVRLGRRVAELEAENAEAWETCKEHRLERERQAAHANALRAALVLIEPRSYGVPRVGDIAAKAIASTPAADLAAHDAEVRKSVLMEAATWFEGSGEPIGKATAQFIRALAAQEVKK